LDSAKQPDIFPDNQPHRYSVEKAADPAFGKITLPEFAGEKKST